NSIYDGFKGLLKSTIKTSMQKEGFARKFKPTVSKWELRQIMRELLDGVSIEDMMGLMEIQLKDYWFLWRMMTQASLVCAKKRGNPSQHLRPRSTWCRAATWKGGNLLGTSGKLSHTQIDLMKKFQRQR
ncbi:MAG: hypothetical protein ACKPKO_19850, partial [Candidatus Fonsibacter sp.]